MRSSGTICRLWAAKQDQFAAAFGGFNLMEFTRDGTYVTPLRLGTATLNELECNLLLCFTGSTHPEGEILKDQVAAYDRHEAASYAALDQLKEITIAMKRALLGGKVMSFGQLLHDAWQNKRKLARGITTDRIERLYGLARNKGAFGGKILGGRRRRLSAGFLPVRPEAQGRGRARGGGRPHRTVRFRQSRLADMAGAVDMVLRGVAVDARPVQSANGTGIGSYTSQMLRALDRAARLDLYLAWTPGEPRLCLRNNAEYWPLGKDDLLEQTALPDWLVERGAQVYHLTQNGLGWPRRGTTPLVVTLHDVIPFLMPEVVRSSYLMRFLSEVPGAVAAARRVITVSAKARADICTVLGADPAKVVVIPSGPAAVFRRRDRAEARRFLAARYRLPRRFVLYVGGYNPRKNVAALVWAFARIVRLLPDRQRLVLVGGLGPHLDRLKRLAAALGIEREVVCPGFVPRRHLPLFYAAADLFCYPFAV